MRNNKDFHETTLDIEGETKLRFAKAYGFRSIQNIVQRLKKASFRYFEKIGHFKIERNLTFLFNIYTIILQT